MKGFPFKQRFLAVAITALVSTSIAGTAQAQSSSPTTQLRNVVEKMMNQEPVTRGDLRLVDEYSRQPSFGQQLAPIEGFDAQKFASTARLYGLNDVGQNLSHSGQTGAQSLIIDGNQSMASDNPYNILDMMHNGRGQITERDRQTISAAYRNGKLDNYLGGPDGEQYRDTLKLYGVDQSVSNTMPGTLNSSEGSRLVIDGNQSMAGDNPYDILGMMHNGRGQITERDRQTINAAYQDGKLDNYLGGPEGDQYRDTLKLYGVNMVASEPGAGAENPSRRRNLIIDSDEQSMAGDNPYNILSMMHNGRNQITERDRQTINDAYQDGKLDNYLGGPEGDRYRETLNLYGVDQSASNTTPGIDDSNGDALQAALDRMDGEQSISKQDQALIQEAYNDGRLDNYLGGPGNDHFKYLLQGYGISMDESFDADSGDSSDESTNSSRGKRLEDALTRMDGERSISREDQALIQEAYNDGRLENYLGGTGNDQFKYLLESYGISTSDRDRSQQSPKRPGIAGQPSEDITVYRDIERSDIIIGVTAPPPPTTRDAVDLSDYQGDGRSNIRPSASEIRDRLQPPSYIGGDNAAEYMDGSRDMASRFNFNSRRLRGSTLHAIGRDGQRITLDDPIEGHSVLGAGLSCMKASEGLSNSTPAAAQLEKGNQRIVVDTPRRVAVNEYINKRSSDGMIHVRRIYQVKNVMLDWNSAGKYVGGFTYAREIKRTVTRDTYDRYGMRSSVTDTRTVPQPWRWYRFGCKTTDVRIPDVGIDLEKSNDYLESIDPTRNREGQSR